MADGVIGEQEVYICLTEFQKRCLPHGHLLSIATAEFAAYMMDPKKLDNFLSAELHHDHPQPYQKVVKCMLHGPCGKTESKQHMLQRRWGLQESKQHALQRRYGKKEFVNETNTNVNGYPQYRRWNNENDK